MSETLLNRGVILGSALLMLAACSSSAAQPDRTPSTSGIATIKRVLEPGGYLDGLAVAGGVLWAADLTGNRVVRVNAGTGTRLPDVTVPGGPLTVLATRGGVWVASYQSDLVSRFDAARGERTATVTTPSKAPCGLAAVGGRLWIFDQSDGAGVLVDATTGQVERHATTTALSGWATYAFGSVWVPDFAGTSDEVVRLDPLDGHHLGSVKTGAGPIMARSGAGSVWVTNTTSDTVTRIDPTTDHVMAQVHVPGAGPISVVVTHNALWVAGYTSNRLYRVDLTTNRVSGSLALPGPPETMVVASGHLWLTTTAGQLVEVTLAG